VLRFPAIILPEDSNLEQQIIDALNQYVAENSGCIINEYLADGTLIHTTYDVINN
jgi:hypothetical protein